VVFTDARHSGRLDLEAVEMATRSAMHRAGSTALQHLLATPADAPREVPCACGARACYHETRGKHLVTALGRVMIERPYYLCPRCHQGQIPRDGELDVVGTQYSPAVRRMMALVGSESSFEHGCEQLEVLAAVEVTAKAVERQAEAIGEDIAQREQVEIRRAVQLELPVVIGPQIPVLYLEMDGTGVPMVTAETKGRVGKNPGDPARTREAKIGCAFTQTTTDEEGRPVRDEGSTTYTGAIETAEEFGQRLYTEAWNRGWSRAEKKAVLGDGAVWIWNLADQHFPGAIQIVDIFHARQHVWELAAKLFAGDEAARKRWAGKLERRLDDGKVEQVVKTLREFPAPTAELTRILSNEADYFERNADRMRYPNFRAQGLFVGSGVIEAGCKTVIGVRLKGSGMFWTVRGANAIIALRCARLSARFEDYWASRSKTA
jgi:hypothetical protein